MLRLQPSVLATLVLLGCGAAPASEQPTPTTATEQRAGGGTEATSPEGHAAAPAALPASIRARVHLPGPDVEDNHLFVTVSPGALPWTISGCVTGAHGACEETQRVELDDASRTELVRLLDEIRAIPRCEPEGIFPGDRAYRLELTGFPRVYDGNLPADTAQIGARNEGPCRADARLAWWIAERFLRRE